MTICKPIFFQNMTSLSEWDIEKEKSMGKLYSPESDRVIKSGQSKLAKTMFK